ncbi:Alanine--tRNA ligase [Trichinella spiralis]|uniref:Alanine--tRNA ligase n=1 Tax=Trichinella spiralis TaxID=6334 RepID=A0ABR3K891_TRISP
MKTFFLFVTFLKSTHKYENLQINSTILWSPSCYVYERQKNVKHCTQSGTRKKCFFENSKFRGLETWLFLRKLATMAAWHIHYYIENRPLIQLDFVAMLSSACYSHTEKHH